MRKLEPVEKVDRDNYKSFTNTIGDTSPREFMAVGMKFHGNHIFSKHDNITLQLEDDNPVDKYAIKVLADGKHVAYVASDCTHKLRSKKHLLIRKVSLVKVYPKSAKLRLGYAGTLDEIAHEKELAKAYNNMHIQDKDDICPVM